MKLKTPLREVEKTEGSGSFERLECVFVVLDG